MEKKLYLIASLVLVLGIFGVGIITFRLWTLSPTSGNVNEIPESSISVAPVLDDSAATIPNDGVSETTPLEATLGDNSSLSSGGFPFSAARRMYPDNHPIVATFKSLFTEDQLETLSAMPEMKRFLEIIETPEYAEFLTADPTNKEIDEFWAEHGFIQDPDRFQKAFREAFPTGEPEDFELEMRQTFAEIFRDVDETNMMQAIVNRAPQFFEDPRNFAWIKGYFDGESGDFGKWAENILENLSANLVEDSSPEDAFLMEDPSPTVDITQETDTHEDTDVDVPDLPDVEKMTEVSASPPRNSERPAPEVIDINQLNQLLRDDNIDALFTEDSLETMFSERINAEHFSIERVQRAMDVLNRHGPKEGLRKLRDSDPEVAKQIAVIIQERQEN